MEIVVPDIKWYSSVSSQKNLPPRCPYANVNRCPSYYESLSLLGSVGITTAIDPSEEKRLLKKWKNSEFRPTIREHEPSIWNNKDLHNFCPEVVYDAYGLFASELHHYADYIDTHTAHDQLAKNGASKSDWRWQWQYISPLHYSECRLYSLIVALEPDRTQETGVNEIFEAKPGVAGFTINIKEIAKRIWRRFFSRQSQ